MAYAEQTNRTLGTPRIRDYISLIPFVVLYIQQGTVSTESFVPTQPALQILLSLMAIYSIAVVLILFPLNTFRSVASGIRGLCVVLNLLMFSTVWGIFNGWFFASRAFAHPNTESSQWHGFLAAIMVTILMWTTLLPAWAEYWPIVLVGASHSAAPRF